MRSVYPDTINAEEGNCFITNTDNVCKRVNIATKHAKYKIQIWIKQIQELIEVYNNQ